MRALRVSVLSKYGVRSTDPPSTRLSILVVVLRDRACSSVLSRYGARLTVVLAPVPLLRVMMLLARAMV